MFAKRFFYSSAGLLCLALAYQLGAGNATALAPGGPVITAYGWRDTDLGQYAAVVGRSVYLLSNGVNRQVQSPIPGTSPVVCVGGDMANTVNNVSVVLENGDAYACAFNDDNWRYEGNVLAAPTPALRETWGQLKGRYR